MNFKQWLISEEEEKDINLSNPNLTSTIPTLNTSLSNPNLTTTIPPLNTSVSNPSLTTIKISSRELASNKKVEALGIKYQELGGKYPPEFKSFLNNKRIAYRDFIDGKKNPEYVWYPSDIKIARDNGLPKNWMLFADYEKESNQKVEALAIEYIRVGEFAKLPPEFKNFLNNKRMAYRAFIKGIKSTNVWYPSDIKIARDNGLPKNWMLQIDLEKESNKQVEALGIRYQELGGKYPPEFKNFLKIKRRAYQEYKNGKENPELNWYSSDIEVAEKNGLPKNWMDSQIETIKSKNEQKSNDRLEKLAYYYGRNGSAPSASESNKENKSLAGWLNDKKRRNNPYEKSDDITWAKIVELSKTWDKEQFPYDLPEDWRIIEPAGKKSLGEEYVLSILTELGIENKTQYRDVACKNKMCLPFDFSITHNGKKYFLEYNGKQHYIPSYFGSGEEMTKQEIAKDALKQFEYIQGNDTIKYEYCEREKIPFLVIPYWLYKNPDFIKNTIIEFLKTNEFNETFANPNVPSEYKVKHDKIYENFLAKSKLTELVDPKTTTSVTQEPTKTFEQFLINKIL